MFDDYNGYFKGNRTGVPRNDAIGVRSHNPPLPPRALPSSHSGDPPTAETDKRFDQKNNTWCSGQISAFPTPKARCERALAPPYIRSIMALPKPEHETWVDPGMSRAKS